MNTVDLHQVIMLRLESQTKLNYASCWHFAVSLHFNLSSDVQWVLA